MTNKNIDYQKLEYIHYVLQECLRIKDIDVTSVEQALSFVEDIREKYLI